MPDAVDAVKLLLFSLIVASLVYGKLYVENVLIPKLRTLHHKYRMHKIRRT